MTTHSPLRLDHVVRAVPDLSVAVQEAERAGFQVVPGGEHAGRTSHNALVCLADGAYLELIAWRAPCEEPWYTTLQDHGAGWVDMALWPVDVDAVVQASVQRGLNTWEGSRDGGRVRPDGLQVRWKSARQTTRALPFLCQDLTPRDWRVPQGPQAVHANGASGIAAVVVELDGPDGQRVQQWEALVGCAAVAGTPPGLAVPLAPILAAYPSTKGVWHLGLDGCTVVLLQGAAGGRGPGPAAVMVRTAEGLMPL